jgi:glycosyltransferase involved in cell wall biosynthesis
MRVAFVSQPRDPIVASGVQRGSVAIVTWELARHIAESHLVQIYAPQSPGEAREERAANGVTIRRVPRSFRQLHKILDIGTGIFELSPPYFSMSAFHREYASDVANELSRDPPDIIHVQTYAQFIPQFRRAAPKARIVFQVHDELLTRVFTPALEERIGMADAIVTCSDYITQKWRARFPAKASRIETIGNGVDLERFRPGDPAPSNRRVLYVGRVSPEKGVHVLVQAFERLLTEVPDAELVIVGPAGLLPWSQVSLLKDDPHIAALQPFYGNTLSDRIDRQIVHARESYSNAIVAGVSAATRARIQVRGAVSYDDVPRLYQESAVLAVPSLVNEPFGLPLAEAMASGLPIVASRCGGIPELVTEGSTGSLVERGDVEALAQALRRALTEPTVRSGMRHAARSQAEARFGWQLASARLARTYDPLTGAVPASA